MKLTITPKQFARLQQVLEAAFVLPEMQLVLRHIGKEPEDVVEAAVRPVAFGATIANALRGDWLLHLLDMARQKRPADADLDAITMEIEIRAHAAPVLEKLRDELVALLEHQEIPAVQILAAYRSCAPPDWEEDLGRFPLADPLATAVYKLSDAPQRRNQFPLVAFAEVIRRKIAPRNDLVARRLEVWVERAFDEAGIGTEMREAIRAQRPEARLESWTLHLIVAVRRDVRVLGTTAPPAYLVRAWKMIAGPHGAMQTTPLEDSEASYSYKELRARIAKLVARVSIDDERYGTPTVELFLEYELLAQDFDQQLTAELVPQPIGSACEFLLRSYDRAFVKDERYASARVRWRKLWKQHFASPRAWKCDKKAFDAARCAAIVDKKKFTSIILHFVPTEADYAKGGAVWTAISTGMPVLVWPRTARHKIHRERFFGGLARRRTNWPSRIQAVRLTAANETKKDHFAKHISLLWDDPHRIPPDEGMEVPR